MYLLDTCVCISALTPETSSERVIQWLETKSVLTLAINELNLVEFSAAVSKKLRTGNLKENDIPEIVDKFSAFHAPLRLFSIRTFDYYMAELLCAERQSKLRTLDALHCAVAIRHNATLVTTDKPLADATGMAEGRLRCLLI